MTTYSSMCFPGHTSVEPQSEEALSNVGFVVVTFKGVLYFWTVTAMILLMVYATIGFGTYVPIT